MWHRQRQVGQGFDRAGRIDLRHLDWPVQGPDGGVRPGQGDPGGFEPGRELGRDQGLRHHDDSAAAAPRPVRDRRLLGRDAGRRGAGGQGGRQARPGQGLYLWRGRQGRLRQCRYDSPQQARAIIQIASILLQSRLPAGAIRSDNYSSLTWMQKGKYDPALCYDWSHK
jgi:hypothetical protein